MSNYGSPPSGYGAPQGYGPPHGYPQGPPPPKKGMGIGTIILIVIGCLILGTCGTCVAIMGSAADKTSKALAAAGSATPIPTPTAQATTAQPIATATATEDPQPVPAISVTAGKLFSAYQANEVSADAAYKGKILAVTGTVSKIRKSFTDSIIINLATSNEFMSVAANMQDSETAAAGALSKGVKVTVICEGHGMVIGSPQLTDCVFAH